MDYNLLIKTVSEIVENDDITKDGLILTYELDTNNHKKMDEHLFYMSNKSNEIFKHRDIVNIEIGGILVRLIKKDLEIQ
jgi:hypothetical protein